jgi:hypothetical protein
MYNIVALEVSVVGKTKSYFAGLRLVSGVA